MLRVEQGRSNLDGFLLDRLLHRVQHLDFTLRIYHRQRRISDWLTCPSHRGPPWSRAAHLPQPLTSFPRRRATCRTRAPIPNCELARHVDKGSRDRVSQRRPSRRSTGQVQDGGECFARCDDCGGCRVDVSETRSLAAAAAAAKIQAAKFNPRVRGQTHHDGNTTQKGVGSALGHSLKLYISLG